MLVWGCTRSFGWLWSGMEFRVRAGVNDLVWDGDGHGLGFGGVGDSSLIVRVDGGEGAEEQAVDISQNGGAARGYVVLGQELVEVAEGVVDALGGLEALGIPDERRVDVGGFSLLLGSEMVGTQAGALVRGEETALATRGSSNLEDFGHTLRGVRLVVEDPHQRLAAKSEPQAPAWAGMQT
jgi:hypothetical protein